MSSSGSSNSANNNYNSKNKPINDRKEKLTTFSHKNIFIRITVRSFFLSLSACFLKLSAFFHYRFNHLATMNMPNETEREKAHKLENPSVYSM